MIREQKQIVHFKADYTQIAFAMEAIDLLVMDGSFEHLLFLFSEFTKLKKETLDFGNESYKIQR